MADCAYLRPVAAQQPKCTDSGAAPRVASIASSRRNNRRTALFLCSVAALLVFGMAIVLFGVYLAQRQRNRGGPPNAGKQFCCPDEVASLSRYVNTAASPCINFFAYVCPNVTESVRSRDAVKYSQPEHAVITGVMPAGVSMGPVGRFLSTYYKTCVQAVARYEDLVSSLANAFLRDATYLLRNVSSREAMVFSATTSVKYYLPGVIDFEIAYEFEKKVSLEFAANCETGPRYRVALTAVVDAVRGATNTTVTLNDTLKLVAGLCGLFREGRRWEANYEVIANTSDAFSQEVWNVEDLQAAMNSLGFSLSGMRVITVQGIKEIRQLYDMFNGDESPGLKGAYLIWHSVLSAAEEFNVPQGKYSHPLFKACAESMFTMRGVWDLYKVEFLTSNDKDLQARRIFATIKDTAREHFKESAIFDAEDLDKLEGFFEKVDLVTPMAISKTPVPVPEATLDFGENLLKVHALEVTITAARLSALGATRLVSHRDVFIVEDRYILLSPACYSYIRTGPSSKSQLPNMALLGELLAESLWGIALFFIQWQSKTAANIERLQECFAANYFKDVSMDETDARAVVITALGLSTVVKALNSAEWHVIKPAWSLWSISQAQLFYIVNSHHRCTEDTSPDAVLEINAPLMYNEDFAESFRCLSNDSMKHPFQCPVSEVHRK